MSDTTSEHDDLSSTQEYTIAGIVILLFGLLYWLFNHGFPGFNLSSNAAQPATAIVADGNQAASQNQLAAKPSAEQDSTADSDQSGADSSKQQFVTKQAPSADGNTKTQLAQAGTESAGSGGESDNTAQSTQTDQSENTAATDSDSNANTQNAAAIAAGNSATQQQTQSCIPPVDLAKRVITDPAVLKLSAHLLNGEMEQSVLMDSFSFVDKSEQAEMSADTQTLDLAALIQQNPGTKVLIRGHTASEGSAADSKALSLGRATSVGQKLVAACVAADSIIIMGMGDAEPLSSDNNQQNRGKNRRIDVAITQ